jgi:hypothetical protein
MGRVGWAPACAPSPHTFSQAHPPILQVPTCTRLGVWFNAAHRAERYCGGDFERGGVIDSTTRYLFVILERFETVAFAGAEEGMRAGSIEWSLKRNNR